MFNYKKLPVLILISAILFSCEDTEPEPVVQGIPSPPGVKFEASGTFSNIQATPIAYHPQVVLEVSHQGNGDSNLMASFQIEATHKEETFQRDDHWSLESGEFLISNPQGDSLYGNYNGNGSRTNSGMSSLWTLSIRGGTGQFASASGILYARVESAPTTDDDQFNITGRISVPQKDNI